MNRSVSGSLMEIKPGVFEELAALGSALGSPLTKVVNGQRAVYGGYTLVGIVTAAIALGVDPHTDRVSVEANIAVGGSGFYVVDDVSGVKEIREACR